MSDALVKFEAEANGLKEMLPEVVVVDDASYAAVADILVEVKTRIKEIDDERQKISKPQYEAWQATNALFRKLSEKYEAAETELKAKLAAYHDKKREEENRLLAEVSKAENHSIAALALVEASAPVAPGVQMKPTLAWEIEDASQVPDEFWVIDEKKVAKAVKAKVKVPGIRVFTKTTVAAGTR